jgi:tape measure domain-containing protein
MADIQQTVEILFTGTNSTATAVSSIQSSLGDLGTEARTATNNLDATNDELDRLGNQNKGIQTATDALKALAASLVAKDFVDANIAIEGFRNTLKLVTGSADEAEKELQFIIDTSNKLGIELRGAAGAFASFAAAAKGTAAEGQGSRQVFEGFVTAFAALGTSGADVAGAFTQLSQGVSKGKFELEDLKSVAERLPGFFNTFAASLGVTNEEFFDLISKGQIGIPELIKVADQLKITFGSADFSSFNNELSRLQNSITSAFVVIGNAGAFDLLKKAIEGGTIAITGAVAAFTLLGDVIGIVAGAIGQLDFSRIATAFASGGLAGIVQEIQKESSTAGKAIEDAIDKAAKSVDNLVPKFLGLQDESKKTAAANTEVKNALLQAGDAFDQAAAAGNNLATANNKTGKSSKDISKDFLDQQNATLNAKKAADDFLIKMESIASNERIKNIDARVALDIAQAQAAAQVITATFQSLGTTVTSTGNVISSALGALPNISGFYGLEQLKEIAKQLEKENTYRQNALALQKALTAATIANLNAKTQAMQSGNALIKIDGAGLQPHLEAFMWEILKTIQVRVNADGLDMLVGV